MAAAELTHLADRGLVSLEGPDSRKLLQGIITNDIDDLKNGDACYAALLTPQGKILFDFFVVATANGFVLDVEAASAAALAKRLAMYKLRANVLITELKDVAVFANWQLPTGSTKDKQDVIVFQDPRHPKMGKRVLPLKANAAHAPSASETPERYVAHRIDLGVPEGGKDFAFGDAYPHEANLDRLHGVSFTKGCYVGQEVVARMQHKTVVRKRIVKVTSDKPVVSGAAILLGDAPIGRIGSVDGMQALAMLRLDRALEAQAQERPLRAGDAVVTPDADELTLYAALANSAPASARS